MNGFKDKLKEALDKVTPKTKSLEEWDTDDIKTVSENTNSFKLNLQSKMIEAINQELELQEVDLLNLQKRKEALVLSHLVALEELGIECHKEDGSKYLIICKKGNI